MICCKLTPSDAADCFYGGGLWALALGVAGYLGQQHIIIFFVIKPVLVEQTKTAVVA